MIKLANSDITGIKLGNDEIVRVYLGNNLIFQKDNWHLVEQRYAPDFNTNSWIIMLPVGHKVALHSDANTDSGVRVQLFESGMRMDMVYINNTRGYMFERLSTNEVLTQNLRHNSFTPTTKDPYKKINISYNTTNVYIVIDSFTPNNLTYVYEPKELWEA